MINIFLFFLVFFFLACAVKFLFNFKIEIAMFIGICAATLIIALSAVCGVLSIGLYAVYIIAAFSFLYSIFYIIKKKSEFKQILQEIFTPGMIILLLAYFTYFFVIRDKVFVYRDEATSWAFEIKYMYTMGVHKSVSSHNNIMAYLSYFMTRITRYSEPSIFLSRWFFIWACVIIPIADLKWSDWIKAVIYAVGAYCIISIINPAPVYYMDMPLGIIAGALCARWSISKIKTKDYVWLYAGLIILINIKDEIGIVITGLCLVYFTICNTIRFYGREKSERKINKVFFALNIGLYLCYMIFAVQSSLFSGILADIISKISILYLIVLLCGIIGIIVLFYLIKRFKKFELIKKYNRVIIGIIIAAISLAGYKLINTFYSGLAFDLQKVFTNAINSLYSKGYFGKSVYILVALAVILVALACILLIKKKSAQIFSVQGISIFIMILIYSTALVIGYVFEPIKEFRDNLANLHRYYAPIFILAAIWLLSRILDNDIEYKKDKSAIIIALVIMSVLVKELPAPGAVMYNNMEKFRYSVTYGLRKDLHNDSITITENKKAKKVFIIAQPENYKWDPFSAVSWIKYEILPITSEGIILTEEKAMHDGKTSSTLKLDEISKYLLDNNFTHVYVYSADEYLFGEFGDLFELNENGNIAQKSMYEITPDNEYFLTFSSSEE